MEIQYGNKVIDRNGKVLGTVDHLVRNTWTGETSKFVVRREPPDEDLFLSPEDIAEITKTAIKLKATAEELGKK